MLSQHKLGAVLRALCACVYTTLSGSGAVIIVCVWVSVRLLTEWQGLTDVEECGLCNKRTQRRMAVQPFSKRSKFASGVEWWRFDY